MELTEPLEAAVVAVAQRAELAMPKRTSLPSMLPPGLEAAGGLIDPQLRQGRVARLFGPDCRPRQDANEDHVMAARMRPALAGVAHHLAEGVAQRGRDQQDRQHLQEIRERRRVFKRMGRVGVEEPAAVRAQLLDGDLRGGRPDGNQLLGERNGLHHRVARGILDGIPVASVWAAGRWLAAAGRSLIWAKRSAPRPARPAPAPDDHRQRQQDIQRGAGQVDPEVAEVGCLRRAKPRMKATRMAMPGRGRDEVLHGQPQHLGQVAHGRSRRRSPASWCW